MSKDQPEHRGKGRPRAFDREQALHAALELFWQEGYEPASVARLCEVMDIKPPSLYASFGNKAALFLEAVRHYEHVYWQEPSARFLEEPDLYRGVAEFFATAAHILLSPETPCGCMLVLAAVNISPAETEIIAAIREMRMATKAMFAERLRRAVADGQIPADTDIAALSGALNALLEGLSLQARDGLSREELAAMASRAVHLLPARGRP
ncbi:MAG: TetR/AcrR family transcriptional regulator [Desulfovibrio sp.]|nr:TetR/AcrR family transcriptional regulator [Desulfovibrio sp.]